MKLSEAIRLGAMLRPQAFYTAFDGHGTCAWGSAFEANGYRPICRTDKWCPLWCNNPWKKLFEISRQCPVCADRISSDAIAHLNDTHKWTRECIADWVETIEAQADEHKQSVAQGVILTSE